MSSQTENAPQFETQHHPLTLSKMSMADPEMMFFPPYHTPLVDPTATPVAKQSVNAKAGDPNQNASKIPVMTPVTRNPSTPGAVLNGAIPTNPSRTRPIQRNTGEWVPTPESKSRVATPRTSAIKKNSLISPAKSKVKSETFKNSGPFRSKSAIIPPSGSAYARNFASTVVKKQATRLANKKTEIFLPPRFGPSNYQTSSYYQSAPPTASPTQKNIPGKSKRVIWSRPSKSTTQPRNNNSNFFGPQDGDPIEGMVKMPVNMFPPEKAHWVQLALEKLLFTGTITRKEMNSPKFQRKIGTLYDSSLDQKTIRTGADGNNWTIQGQNGSEYSDYYGTTVPSPRSSYLGQEQYMMRGSDLGRKSYPRNRKSGTPTSSRGQSSFSVTSNSARSMSTPRHSARRVKTKVKGSRDHGLVDLQKKVSDILLQMLLKGMVADAEDKGKYGFEKVDTSTGSISSGHATIISTEQRSISTNTEIDDDIDDWTWITKAYPVAKFRKGKSTTATATNTVEDLTAPWLGSGGVVAAGSESKPEVDVVEPYLEIKNCFVYEGKVCPLEASKKPISTFAPLSESRRCTEPTIDGYFRKIVDVKGFAPEDITIKYAKTRIFIEAKQSAAEDKNYRIVREIVVLPRGLKIMDLKIMRAKNNGRLVLEEQLFQESGTGP